MTDLVLVRPGISLRAEAHWSANLPLGIGYLASAARAAGLSVDVVDGKVSRHINATQTVDAILRRHPIAVGISAMTVEYPQAREIARRLKAHPSPPIIVLGGVHANALPDEVLEEAPEVDYVIAGEGESSLTELVWSLKKNSDVRSVAGLYTRVDGSRVANDTAPRFDHDLAALPFPAWDLFPPADTYPIMAERGCPYSCVFCSNNMTRRVRSRPVDHVMAELEWLHGKFRARQVFFEDETFGLHKDYSEELLSRMRTFNADKGIRFRAQTRVDRITDRLVSLMKSAGFEYLEIGVESGSQKVLDSSRKAQRCDDVQSAVAAVKRAGLKAWVNFIIGLPEETRQSVRESIELAVRLNPDRLSVATIVAYPGTEIYAWARQGQRGYRLLSNRWDQFDKYLSKSVELQHLPYRTMRRLQLQMYTEVYLRNFRMKEWLEFIWRHREFMSPVLRSFVSKHH